MTTREITDKISNLVQIFFKYIFLPVLFITYPQLGEWGFPIPAWLFPPCNYFIDNYLLFYKVNTGFLPLLSLPSACQLQFALRDIFCFHFFLFQYPVAQAVCHTLLTKLTPGECSLELLVHD